MDDQYFYINGEIKFVKVKLKDNFNNVDPNITAEEFFFETAA